MKGFLQEYGFGILIAIVVIVILCLTTPLGETIGNTTKDIVSGFSNTTNNVSETAGKTTVTQAKLMILSKGDIITIEGHKYRILA